MNTSYAEKIDLEIKQLPPEYLPALFNIVHTFRESIDLKTVAMSFRQGFQEALAGETQPIETLWDVKKKSFNPKQFFGISHLKDIDKQLTDMRNEWER